MSQAKLAEQLGTTQQSIHKYEHGTAEPEHKMLKRMSDFFNVSADYLIDHEIKDLTLDASEQHLISTLRNLDENDRNLICGTVDSLSQKEYTTSSDERSLIDQYRKLATFQKRIISNEMKKMLKEKN